MKKLLIFIVLTFFFSYLMAILYWVLGGKWNTTSATFLAVAYMFIPMIIAIIVLALVNAGIFIRQRSAVQK